MSPTNTSLTNATEQPLSEQARHTIVNFLDETISLVESTIQTVKKSNAVNQEPLLFALSASQSASPDHVRQFMDSTSPGAMGASVKSLTQLAESVEPITKNFDNILVSDTERTTCQHVIFFRIPFSLSHSNPYVSLGRTFQA